MDPLFLVGYAGAVLIGVIIGLLGGGGAILAVPILVYVFGVPTDLATAYSLFVVGVTALLASLRYLPRKQVDYRAAFYFLVPSMLLVYLTRTYVVPAIPSGIAVAGLVLPKRQLLMTAFSLLMVAAGISLLRNLRPAAALAVPAVTARVRNVSVMVWGSLVGFLAGLLGAGGGFMIVPVLVLFMKLPMKTAIGTSLAVIAGQSLSGFAGDVLHRQEIDWPFLARFTALSLGGMWAGTYLANRVSAAGARKAFGIFTVAMGMAILAAEWLL